ncbi:DinB family protein [Deinococcus planocerae]|uniref:DinB family protein n=1 Tax=Deinococcus planocerae TaxID=1737569 RepID=UPI000C7EF66E|nr:DinB family protein [Deinococcus planocerae]
MTQPGLDEQIAALRAALPTPEAVAAELDRELTAFAESLRAAEPHWHAPMPGRTWTPAQEAEHTILVNEGTARVVRLLLSDKPLRETPGQEGRTENGRRLAPQGTEPGPGEDLATLLARNEATRPLLAGVRAGPNPARTFHHPFLGPIDALDWLRMAAAQTRHHRTTLRAGLDRLSAGGHAAE